MWFSLSHNFIRVILVSSSRFQKGNFQESNDNASSKTNVCNIFWLERKDCMYLGRAWGDKPKGTIANQRFSAGLCSCLQLPAKICGFLRKFGERLRGNKSILRETCLRGSERFWGLWGVSEGSLRGSQRGPPRNLWGESGLAVFPKRPPWWY